MRRLGVISTSKRGVISFIVMVLLILGTFSFVNAAGELPGVPAVGPGVCAWKVNGQRCDERIQRCAQGCPPLSSGSSISQPSEGIAQPSRQPEPAQMSCSRATSFCISECQRSSEAASECLVRCMAGKIGNRRELTKCLQRMSLSVSEESRIATDTGVNTGKLNKELSSNLNVINNIFVSETGRNAFVTSAFRDWKPGDKFSYHQTGDAVDLRIKHLTLRDQINVFRKLQKRLGSDYDICLELPDIKEARSILGNNACLIVNQASHIHVEYDRNRVKRATKEEVPPPIVTQYEMPIEEKAITNPTLVQKLNDAFGKKTILYDQTLKVPEGLDVRVSTSEKDLVIWGAKAVGNNIALKVAKYAIPEPVLVQLKRELEPLHQDWEAVSSIYEISQVDPKVSGNYAVGPFTVEINYLPELLPEHYEGKDLGIFHVIVEGQKAKIKRLQNKFIDPIKKVIFGKTEGFSMFIVAVMSEERNVMTGAMTARKPIQSKMVANTITKRK